MLINPSGAIHTAADLNGKKVGAVPTPLVWLETKLWLAANGGDPSTITFVPVAQYPSAGAFLKNGSVDAVIDVDPFTQQAQQDLGLVSIGAPSRQIPPGTTSAAFFASTAWLHAHPELAAAFAASIRDGRAMGEFRYCSRQSRASCQVYAGRFSGARSEGARDRQGLPLLELGSGPVNVAATQAWIDLAVKYGVLAKPLELKESRVRHGRRGDAAMSEDIDGINHVGLAARDMETIAARYAAFGFILTPFSQHAGAHKPGEPLQSWGSGNRCAMLNNGFLEIIANTPAVRRIRASTRFSRITRARTSCVSIRPTSRPLRNGSSPPPSQPPASLA